MQEKERERDCMSFDGFCQCVRMDIQKRLGSGFEVSLKDITKNNDTMLKGLMILERDTSLCPTIYMEEPYDRYSQGEPLEEIEDNILRCYQEKRMEEEFDLGFFKKWETAKERIVYKLVSRDRNKELLREVPYREILDLAVVFECYLGKREAGHAVIPINNGHIKAWGVTADELYAVAVKNTPELMGCRSYNMEELVREIRGIGADSLPDRGGPKRGDMPMYLLTNEHKYHGAGCILYSSLLEELADEWECDICIIPSSIHETLLIPMYMSMGCERMTQMIREVNQTHLEPEEVLSDHAYQFCRETGKIIIQEEKSYE